MSAGFEELGAVTRRVSVSPVAIAPSPEAMTSRPHDALFKDTFTNLDNARGELRSVLPSSVAALVDWSTLRLEPGTFVDEALREEITDLLFSVRIQQREARVYMLFEHQSTPDPLMPFRALSYVVRIWRLWLDDHPKAQSLPPVVPVLLAQVEGGWKTSRELAEVIDFADELERAALEPLVPSCRLVVDELATVTDAMLDARPMPAAAKLALAMLATCAAPMTFSARSHAGPRGSARSPKTSRASARSAP